MKFTLSAWAKYFSVAGGSLALSGKSGAFGKWSPAADAIGVALMAIGAAMASQTSAGHPNGAA